MGKTHLLRIMITLEQRKSAEERRPRTRHHQDSKEPRAHQEPLTDSRRTRATLAYVTQNVPAIERPASFIADLTRTDLLVPGCWRSKLLFEVNELMRNTFSKDCWP